MLTKETLEKTSDFQKNILRRGIIKAGLFLLGISLLAPDGILQMILFCASMICMLIQLFLDVFLRRKGIDIRVDANESWETYQRQLKNDSILCGISFVIFLAIELLFRFQHPLRHIFCDIPCYRTSFPLFDVFPIKTGWYT